MDVNEIILKHLPGADILPRDNDPESNHTCLVVTRGPLKVILWSTFLPSGESWAGAAHWTESGLNVDTRWTESSLGDATQRRIAGGDLEEVLLKCLNVLKEDLHRNVRFALDSMNKNIKALDQLC